MKKLDILFKLLVLVTFCWFLHDIYTYFSPKKLCRDFISRKQVDVYYYSDPVKYKYLDRDGNGVPCQTYNYGSSK